MTGTIKYSNWVYQLAYGWRHETQQPKTVTPFKLLGDVMIGIVALLIVTVVGVGVVVIGSVYGLLIAKRVSFRDMEDGGFLAPFVRWPTIRGQRIYPIVVMGFATLAWLLWEAVASFFVGAPSLFSEGANTTLIRVVALIALFFNLAALFWSSFKQKNTYQTYCTSLKAWCKRKICPVWTVTNDK